MLPDNTIHLIIGIAIVLGACWGFVHFGGLGIN